jgi:hypothetical protein
MIICFLFDNVNEQLLSLVELAINVLYDELIHLML